MHKRVKYMSEIKDTLTLTFPANSVDYPHESLCMDCLAGIYENLGRMTDIQFDADSSSAFSWLCTASCRLKIKEL